MKIRVIDRLLCALSGLILLAAGAALVAQTAFQVELTALLGNLMSNRTTANVAIIIGAIVVLALLGIYGVSMLFRRGQGKRGFVLQKTENGELSISIRAIEGLVQKCVDKHEELRVTSTTLDTCRDGLIIKLRIDLASGVNIPLAVSALQKQIKQYITACSGVDVKEVRVQVETAASKVADSPYAVPDMLQNPPPLPKEEIKGPEACAPADKEEKKPLHQRLFGSEEQPAIVPAPPEVTVAEAEEPAEAETTTEAQAEPAPEGEDAEGAEAAVTAPEETSEEESHEVAE